MMQMADRLPPKVKPMIFLETSDDHGGGRRFGPLEKRRLQSAPEPAPTPKDIEEFGLDVAVTICFAVGYDE
jgi:hypothetical protein